MRHSLKFDMQQDHIQKKKKNGLGAPHTKCTQGSDSGLKTIIPFDRFHIFRSPAWMQSFVKNIDNGHIYLEI